MNVHLMVQPGLDAELVRPVISGFKYVANIVNPILGEYAAELVNLGYWQGEDYQNVNGLVPHRSINWFIERAHLERKAEASLNAGTLILEGQTYALKNPSCRMYIFVVNHDLVHPKKGYGFAFTSKYRGSVINVGRFLDYGMENAKAVIKTLAVHEFGHLFGLISEDRVGNKVEALGLHCTKERCVMQQGVNAEEWFRMTFHVVNSPRYFCLVCQNELYQNAKQWRELKSRSR